MQKVFQQNLYEGKIVLISGGATGICYEIAKQFLLHGAGVYIISRKIENINKAVKTLAESTKSNKIWGSSCDVRKEAEIQETVKNVVSKHGNIDVLVNGAAGNFLCSFENLSPNAFRTVLMIDTVGTFLLSKYVTQYGLKNGGVIINITANLHHNGTAMQTHAGTAKAGVDALTKHLAVELGPKNIRVIGVSPGIIQGTEGFDRLKMEKTEKQSEIHHLVPLQRLGWAVDIANCCLFVASPLASYITGQTIQVDGGVVLTMPNFPFSNTDFLKGYPSFGVKPKL